VSMQSGTEGSNPSSGESPTNRAAAENSGGCGPSREPEAARVAATRPSVVVDEQRAQRWVDVVVGEMPADIIDVERADPRGSQIRPLQLRRGLGKSVARTKDDMAIGMRSRKSGSHATLSAGGRWIRTIGPGATKREIALSFPVRPRALSKARGALSRPECRGGAPGERRDGKERGKPSAPVHHFPPGRAIQCALIGSTRQRIWVRAAGDHRVSLEPAEPAIRSARRRGRGSRAGPSGRAPWRS
jgi:hypothetical protein